MVPSLEIPDLWEGLVIQEFPGTPAEHQLPSRFSRGLGPSSFSFAPHPSPPPSGSPLPLWPGRDGEWAGHRTGVPLGADDFLFLPGSGGQVSGLRLKIDLVGAGRGLWGGRGGL